MSYANRYFLCAIDTDMGKTLCSAILTQALGADYWKPVQSGCLQPGEFTDTQLVSQWVRNPKSRMHPERYRFALPQSPHLAAAHEGCVVSLEDFEFPESGLSSTLIMEGAGGVLVPLNESDYVVDLAVRFAMTAIVVTQHYLGSLNHTLLTIEALRQRDIPIAGLIINRVNPSAPFHRNHTQFLSRHTQLPILLEVGEESCITPEVVARYAKDLRNFPESRHP